MALVELSRAARPSTTRTRRARHCVCSPLYRRSSAATGAEGCRVQRPRDLRAYRRELHQRQQAPDARAGARARGNGGVAPARASRRGRTFSAADFCLSSKAVTSAVDGCVIALRGKQVADAHAEALFGRADVVWFTAVGPPPTTYRNIILHAARPERTGYAPLI